eukprot:9496699-Alexandrium_andersonii.AAC.1
MREGMRARQEGAPPRPAAAAMARVPPLPRAQLRPLTALALAWRRPSPAAREAWRGQTSLQTQGQRPPRKRGLAGCWEHTLRRRGPGPPTRPLHGGLAAAPCVARVAPARSRRQRRARQTPPAPGSHAARNQ